MPATRPPAVRPPAFALVESNTTGSGRQFAAAARDRGLRPVLLSANPRRYPYVATDVIEVVPTDTADPVAVLRACRGLRDDGGLAGVTSSSEYYVAVAADSAAVLGLPAVDAAAVRRCRDKLVQRTVLAAAGVAVPRFRAVSGGDEAAAAAAEIGGPVVVKPVSGSGSVGVRLCADAGEARDHAAALLAGAEGPVLVEDYVIGPEFSVETFHGEVVAVIGKHLGAPPAFVELGHDCPARVSEQDAAALARCATEALAACGVLRGAAHTELRLGPAGPVVIEINPRLAGGMIPTLVRATTGTDLVDRVVAFASGQPDRALQPQASHAAIRFLVADRSGTVLRADGTGAAAALPGVERAVLTLAVGDRIELDRSFRDRVGYVIATASRAEDAAARAARGRSLLDVEIGPPRSR